MGTRTYTTAQLGGWPPGIHKLQQEIEDNVNIAVPMLRSNTFVSDLTSGSEVLTVGFAGEPTGLEDLELTTVIIPGHVGGNRLESPTEFTSATQSQTTENDYKPKLDTSDPGPNPRIDAGTYLVSWSVDYGGTSVGTVISMRVYVGTTIIATLEDVTITVDDSLSTWAGEAQITLATGYHRLAIEFKRVSAAAAAITENARIGYEQV